jgi:death on curing protein
VNPGPVWLTVELVQALHRRALELHGGLEGIRDAGALESAVARPRSAQALGETGLVRLAAMYAQSLVKNHPFLDGNKRIAFLSVHAFLALNGRDFHVEADEVARTFRALASSEVGFDEFTDWLSTATRPRPSPPG